MTDKRRGDSLNDESPQNYRLFKQQHTADTGIDF
jgi:hypothetical protein